MLSRTADHLLWMARYIERAENTARMLDVTVQTSLIPQPIAMAEQGWRSMLGISKLQEKFDKKHTQLTPQNVLDFMVRDPNNPSSIYSCLMSARENARAVRGQLTTEVWESHNTTWLLLQDHLQDGWLEQNPSQFFEWVKYRSHLSRGVTIGTMLKDEAFYFIRLGTFLERADSTARLLDVKFYGAEKNKTAHKDNKKTEHVSNNNDTQFDFYYWTAILRSVSAFEIYRKVYRDVITPERVAELLMLRADMPRSLLASMNEVVANLKEIRNDLSSDTERLAGKLQAQLQFDVIDDILEAGLHDYLTQFLEKIFELGQRISRDFLVPSTT